MINAASQKVCRSSRQRRATPLSQVSIQAERGLLRVIICVWRHLLICVSCYSDVLLRSKLTFRSHVLCFPSGYAQSNLSSTGMMLKFWRVRSHSFHLIMDKWAFQKLTSHFLYFLSHPLNHSIIVSRRASPTPHVHQKGSVLPV